MSTITPEAATTTATYRQAIIRALGDELEADPSVFLLGEDVGAAGGPFKMTDGLYERFGAGRVMDTPISEQAIVGAAIGAAVKGLRPVGEIMFADFAGVCFDGIANELAKYRYMTGGQVTLPVTLRLGGGVGAGFGAQHSQNAENWFLNVPGLKLVTPATPADAYGLLRASIQDPDPVLFFEHKHLFNHKGPFPERPAIVPLGVADVVRAGTDVTLVGTQAMRFKAERAAEALADEGISVEVIDPRTIAPFDHATVIDSVQRTGRLIVLQEASPDGSWGASVISRVVQENFEYLDAPPRLHAADDTPVPYAENLETAWMPTVRTIVEAVRATVAY
ncbi:MAG TPA: pyruvate dehydrogenase complex E1 component subunit beta [Baekduia sp.]|uniref:alpha-ketoacid dehydrogenase subunit beta n=1 Tax=Baekduia sp. TaxID=2600305 RepID=UPI002D77643D|nr:pyruvate dehydrogenase complex E1 component subunit beta [Baekduia sp.]HET6507983.1 pyruvate dehydrogenase complex E1 component subunit beta [Baekduia sp.]